MVRPDKQVLEKRPFSLGQTPAWLGDPAWWARVQAEVPPRRVMERPSDSWILRPNFPRENYQNFTEKPGGTPSGRYC